MLVLLFVFLIVIIIGVAFGVLIYNLGKKYEEDMDKNSSFECGFDSLGPTRLPFSLRFFLLAVVFLVFDVETVLLMPMPYLNYTSGWEALLGVGGFLLILILGLLHEYKQGSLEWV